MNRLKIRTRSAVSEKILSTLRSWFSKKFRAFTLVELIVVITILAILATIGFLALSGYTSDAGKTTVVSNIRTVEKGLSTNATVTGKFPIPTNPVDVTYSGGIVWRQGTAGKTVMAVIGMGEPPRDPQWNAEFDYSLTANGMEFQVASAYLGSASADPFVTTASAAEFSSGNVRTPTAVVSGNYNGLFVPVSTGGTNYLVASPSIVLADVTLIDRELKAMAPQFVVDGKLGTPASWSGKVQWLVSTGISFGGTGYVSGQVFASASEAFPTTSTGLTDVANKLSAAYSGTVLASAPKIAEVVNASSTNNTSVLNAAVSSAGANSLGRELSPVVAAPSSSGGSPSSSGGGSAPPPASAYASGTYQVGDRFEYVTATNTATVEVTTATNVNGTTVGKVIWYSDSTPVKSGVCDAEDIAVARGTDVQIWNACNLGQSISGSGNVGTTYNVAKMGNLYQWGNNGAMTATTTATSTSDTAECTGSVPNALRVDTTSYGPSNPYSNDSLFILNATDWSYPTPYACGISGGNTNLWGQITNTSVARKGPCPAGYHVPGDAEWVKTGTIFNSDTTNFFALMKVPYSGWRNGTTGAMERVGSYTATHTSKITGQSSAYVAFNNGWYGSTFSPGSATRNVGRPVRCIKN